MRVNWRKSLNLIVIRTRFTPLPSSFRLMNIHFKCLLSLAIYLNDRLSWRCNCLWTGGEFGELIIWFKGELKGNSERKIKIIKRLKLNNFNLKCKQFIWVKSHDLTALWWRRKEIEESSKALNESTSFKKVINILSSWFFQCIKESYSCQALPPLSILPLPYVFPLFSAPFVNLSPQKKWAEFISCCISCLRVFASRAYVWF